MNAGKDSGDRGEHRTPRNRSTVGRKRPPFDRVPRPAPVASRPRRIPATSNAGKPSATIAATYPATYPATVRQSQCLIAETETESHHPRVCGRGRVCAFRLRVMILFLFSFSVMRLCAACVRTSAPLCRLCAHKCAVATVRAASGLSAGNPSAPLPPPSPETRRKRPPLRPPAPDGFAPVQPCRALARPFNAA